MITIQNIGGNPLGESTYEVAINGRILGTFTHSRPDGLTVCLQKAAEAVEKHKWEKMAKDILRVCETRQNTSA